MRKVIIFCLLISFLLPAGIGHSALIRNGGIIFDDVNNQYWYAILLDFGGLDFNQQVSAISDLNLNPTYTSTDWGPWHMASRVEMEELWGYSPFEIAAVFEPTFFDVTLGQACSGYYDEEAQGDDGLSRHYRAHTEVLVYPNESMSSNFPLGSNSWADINSAPANGAWVTANATVPIPSAIYLFFSGLIGIIGFKRKFQK